MFLPREARAYTPAVLTMVEMTPKREREDKLDSKLRTRSRLPTHVRVRCNSLRRFSDVVKKTVTLPRDYRAFQREESPFFTSIRHIRRFSAIPLITDVFVESLRPGIRSSFLFAPNSQTGNYLGFIGIHAKLRQAR